MLFLSQSCGNDKGSYGDEDQQEEESTNKNLFSLWRRSDGRSIDLSGTEFNRSTSFTFEFNLGSSL